MSEKKGTAIAVMEKFTVPALPDKESIAMEMDGLPFDFERVKIPSGGGLAFEVPGEDDDSPDMAKEISGVIVYHHPANAYWAEKYTGANNPPDCSSMDGKFGEGDPGGPCAACQYNQFGSDPEGGGGKACKNMRRIYILREGEIFPLLVTLSPMSLRNFGRYVSRRVLQRGLRTYKVVTNIALKKATSSGGIVYSQATFKMAGVLPEDVAAGMEQYGNFVKNASLEVAIGADDYDITEEDTTEEPF